MTTPKRVKTQKLHPLYYDREFERGYDAADTDKENPHKEGSLKRDAWNHGYCTAKIAAASGR